MRWSGIVRGSGPQGPYRNLPLPTHQSTTTSTTTVTSTAATSSNRTVLPPWPSGVRWRPERLRPAPLVRPVQVCLTMPAYDPTVPRLERRVRVSLQVAGHSVDILRRRLPRHARQVNYLTNVRAISDLAHRWLYPVTGCQPLAFARQRL